MYVLLPACGDIQHVLEFTRQIRQVSSSQAHRRKGDLNPQLINKGSNSTVEAQWDKVLHIQSMIDLANNQNWNYVNWGQIRLGRQWLLWLFITSTHLQGCNIRACVHFCHLLSYKWMCCIYAHMLNVMIHFFAAFFLYRLGFTTLCSYENEKSQGGMHSCYHLLMHILLSYLYSSSFINMAEPQLETGVRTALHQDMDCITV